MKTKPLYLLVSDCGDGSYFVQFSMSTEWIKKQQELYDNDELDYDSAGVDGDGFSYNVLQVPVDCTSESLGITLLEEDEEE
jgi:hypothetical protein